MKKQCHHNAQHTPSTSTTKLKNDKSHTSIWHYWEENLPDMVIKLGTVVTLSHEQNIKSFIIPVLHG
jgi:hypothetical protein